MCIRDSCAPFVRIAGLMRDAGVNAPDVLAWNEPQGFLLLTDLGERTMLTALDASRPQDALPLFREALAALAAWQLASQPGALPPYDEAVLRCELALFPQWYLARHRGVALTAAQRQTIDDAFDAIVRRNLAAPQVFVHRDFMPRNLMLPAQPGGALGVLDFQDALIGPVTCLLYTSDAADE